MLSIFKRKYDRRCYGVETRLKFALQDKSTFLRFSFKKSFKGQNPKGGEGVHCPPLPSHWAKGLTRFDAPLFFVTSSLFSIYFMKK